MAARAGSPSRTGTFPATRSTLFRAIIGLAGLGVLLQAVWAALFIREGQDNAQPWVEVHARGAEVTIGLAVIATIVAFVQLRSRRDVVIGSAVFTVLLVVEAYVGGLIGDHSKLQIVHFPLAMALLALAVWLPFQATRPRTAAR